jgi:23S rRNA pseudoU1915 N3-methylase RlmH
MQAIAKDGASKIGFCLCKSILIGGAKGLDSEFNARKQGLFASAVDARYRYSRGFST